MVLACPSDDCFKKTNNIISLSILIWELAVITYCNFVCAMDSMQVWLSVRVTGD